MLFRFLFPAGDPESIINEPLLQPLAKLFGIICNFIFELVYSPDRMGSLALTIVLFTIVTKMILVPFTVKQQKSMVVMRKLQPEITKIQDKYKGSKDPEANQRMSVELQKLYKEHGYSPLSGCLPLFIQMPIIIVLFNVMKEAYRYIDKLGSLYNQLATLVLQIPNLNGPMSLIINDISQVKGKYFNIAYGENCQYVLSKMGPDHWSTLLGNAPPELLGQMEPLLQQKNNIENLYGLSLVERAGFGWPGILIPILAAAFSFLSIWLMNRHQSAKDANSPMQQQQKYMMIFMPLLSGWMAVSFPAGLGIYWIMTYVIQIIQQFVINRIFSPKKDEEEAV